MKAALRGGDWAAAAAGGAPPGEARAASRLKTLSADMERELLLSATNLQHGAICSTELRARRG